MTTPSIQAITPVDVGSIPEYPFDADTRLDTHGFLQWEFRRWMSSDMRWSGSHECKSMWFDLLNLAHSETPVGTLPCDMKRLARMIQPPVDPDHFERLCGQEFGPLHGWKKCQCDGEVRWMHPVVTRIVTQALASRANHAARVEAASQQRKLKRLGEDIFQLSPAIGDDPRKVRWISDHIDRRVAERGGQRRTPEDLHIAIQACLEEARRGRFPDQTKN